MNYIPGPWSVDDSGTVIGKDGAHIAAVSDIHDFPCADPDDMHPEQREEIEAQYAGNARLIAGAPEMYEALKKILGARSSGCSTGEAMSKSEYWAREAIRKVEGER